MTIQTAIDNLNSVLRSISRDSMSDAKDLIEGGAKYLSKLKSDKVPPISFDPSPASFDGVRDFNFFPVTKLKGYELPDNPELQKVNVLTHAGDHSKLPGFTKKILQKNIKTGYSFSEKLPKLPKIPKLPKSPVFDKPEEVALNTPEWFEIADIKIEVEKPDLDFELPDVPEVDHAGLIKQKMEEFVKVGGLEEYTKWVSEIVNKNLFDDLVLDYIQNVIGGEDSPGGLATAVTDDWESQKYRQALNEAMEAYRAELRALPAAARTGATGMPDGENCGQRAMIEFATLRRATKAVEEAAAGRRAIEIKHQKWALALAVKMVGVGLELRFKAVADGIKAMRLGLEAASDAEAITAMLYDFKRKQFELVDKYNQLQIDYLQKKVNVEKQKIEKIKMEAEQNRTISLHNDNLAKQYEIAARWMELEIVIYDAEIEYYGIQQEYNKLRLKSLSLSYKANEANSKSVLLDIKNLEGTISADSAVLRLEDTKFAEFEAEIAKLRTDINVESGMVSSQYGSNKAKLAQWGAKIRAIIQYQQLLISHTETTAQALLAKYRAESEGLMIEIDEQDFENRKELESERRKIQKEYTELRKTLYHFSMLVSQKLAQSQVSIQGASTMSSIAESAFANMTAIGGGSKTEYA